MKAPETFEVELRFGSRAVSWKQRIARPVTDAAIDVALLSRDFGGVAYARATSDYGGEILLKREVIGQYFIVPGSNKASTPKRRMRAASGNRVGAPVRL